MRRFWPVAVVALCTWAGAMAQGGTPGNQPDDSTSGINQPKLLVMDRSLPSGGTVVLEMNVGDVRILPSTGNDRMRLEINASAEYDRQAIASWVKQFEVTGDRAVLEVKVPKDHENCGSCYSGITLTLYVPAQCALKVELGVGDLKVEGIRGDKNLHLGIGDLRVGFNDAAEYGHVQTSTEIGDVSDALSGGHRSGFFRSENFTRQGRFHLKASIGIGDLNLYEEKKS